MLIIRHNCFVRPAKPRPTHPHRYLSNAAEVQRNLLLYNQAVALAFSIRHGRVLVAAATREDRRLVLVVVGPLHFKSGLVFGAKTPPFCVNVIVSTPIEGSC